MAAAKLGILGQVSIATANSDTVLYGPSGGGSPGRRAVISTLFITNNTSSTVTVRVYARMAGAVVGAGNVIVPDVTLQPAGQNGCMLPVTAGITLDGNAGDALSCRASATGVNFTAFGNEEDVS